MKDRRSKAKQAEVIRSLRKKVKTLEKTALARKRAEDALKQSEERFRLFVESTSDWIWAIDRDGRHIYSNPAVEKILGYRAKELEGKDSLLFMHEEDRKMVAAMLPKLITKKSGWSNLIVRWRHKDNTFRYLESNAAPILDDKGKLVGYQGSDRDITERMRVEEALKKLLSQLQATLESTDDAILVVDTESRITNYNKRFLELWQIPKNIMATRNDNAALQYVLNQLKEPEKFLAKVRDLYSHPHEESFDVLEFKDGRIFERFSQPQKLDGKSIGRVWSFRDVTKRKHAEKALQESVEQFRNLAEKTPNMIFINQGGRIVYANEKCNEIMGYTSEELLSPDFDFRRLVAPESLSTVIEKFEEHQRGKEVPPYEYVLITKQGQRLHTIQTTRLITFHGERAILGIITDITERKQIEEALRKQHSALEGVLGSTNASIFSVDRDYKYTMFNSRHAAVMNAFYGATVEVGRSLLDLMTVKADRAKAKHNIDRALAGESHVDSAYSGDEARSRRYIEVSHSPVRLEDGTVVGVAVVSHDITERKKAEDNLVASEKRFRSIWDNSADGMRLTNGEGRIMEVNEAYCRMVRLTRDNLVGKLFSVIYERGGMDDDLNLYLERFRSGEIESHISTTATLWDGKSVDLDISSSFIGINGPDKMLLSIFRDTTERKRAENALRESEYWFKESQKAGRIGSYFTDFTIGYWQSSEVLDEILGIDAKYERSIDGWSKLVHPEDRKEMTDYLTHIVALKIPFEKEYRIIRPSDGKERWVYGHGELSFDKNGLPLSMVGTIQDVTERKRAEETNVLLAQTLKSAQDCISVTDLNDKILFVNQAFLATYGYNEEDLIGNNIAMVRPASLSPLQFGEVLRSTLRGQWHGELINRRKDGTEFPIELWTSVVSDGKGNPIAAVGVARDITDRKRAEERLKKSQEKFRELFDDAPVGYHELDAEGTITNVNLTELGMLGYAKEEMLGRPVWEFAGGGERSRKRVLEKLTGVVPPNKNAEGIYVKKDGNTIPVMVDESLLHNQRGEISGMRTVIQDITEKKRAEEVLQESNAFNEQLVRTLPFGMDIVDERGEILFMSNAMKKLVGSDALGSRCWSAYKDDKTQCYDCPLYEGIDFAEPKKLESTGVLGGKTFQISHIGMMYQGKKAMLEVFVDVTERKQAEGALRQSEAKYRSLFEESKDVVYISTPNGKFFDINPAGVELLGYDSKEEILRLETGQNLFADPHQREEMRKQIEVQGFIKNFEEVLRRKDGQKITVLDTATAVRDPKGRTILFRGIMRDVTKEKQLEEELTQIQKLESIGTLASGVAHDFNNILGIVLGYSSFIERVADDPEKLSQSVQSINAAVQRGASLVQQILTFARKAEVVFGPIDVNVMIKEIVKMLRETFPKTIEMSLQLDRALPFITADATQLHQAFLNISVNARDAMPIGGVLSFKTGIVTGASLRNAFSDVPDGNYAHVSVTDTGIGMDDATRAHIFDPFFTTKEKGKGTGLGLSVVYGVMKKHNGFIDVQSEPGKGTTFNLYFPIPEKSAHGEGRTVEDRGEIPGGTETILIVEDEEALLTMLKVILELKGYHALTAVDGLEALALYREHNAEIALVMTDVGLPKISGDQLFYELKKVNPSVRVVLMSGYMDPGIKSEIFKAGVHDFVQKPYDPNEVLMKVRESIDRE